MRCCICIYVLVTSLCLVAASDSWAVKSRLSESQLNAIASGYGITRLVKIGDYEVFGINKTVSAERRHFAIRWLRTMLLAMPEVDAVLLNDRSQKDGRRGVRPRQSLTPHKVFIMRRRQRPPPPQIILNDDMMGSGSGDLLLNDVEEVPDGSLNIHIIGRTDNKTFPAHSDWTTDSLPVPVASTTPSISRTTVPFKQHNPSNSSEHTSNSLAASLIADGHENETMTTQYNLSSISAIFNLSHPTVNNSVASYGSTSLILNNTLLGTSLIFGQDNFTMNLNKTTSLMLEDLIDNVTRTSLNASVSSTNIYNSSKVSTVEQGILGADDKKTMFNSTEVILNVTIPPLFTTESSLSVTNASLWKDGSLPKDHVAGNSSLNSTNVIPNVTVSGILTTDSSLIISNISANGSLLEDGLLSNETATVRSSNSTEVIRNVSESGIFTMDSNLVVPNVSTNGSLWEDDRLPNNNASANASSNAISTFWVNLTTTSLATTPRARTDFTLYNQPLTAYHSLNDPQWEMQWYFHQGEQTDTFVSLPSEGPLNEPSTKFVDLNIYEAWRLGYTGRGVFVSILDDGLQYNHSEIAHAYDPSISYDLIDGDDDPYPYGKSEWISNINHGTRLAGVIAATPNNSQCVAGVSPGVTLGAVRFLENFVGDITEATALSWRRDIVDIYVCAWGPNDDGVTVDGPKQLTLDSLREGTIYGRSGRGSLFIWSSGNGGGFGDTCSVDGYASSIFTISVAGVRRDGGYALYAEKCPSILVTSFSSSGFSPKGAVVTIDEHDQCVDDFTGTSAATALASGVVALVLEANPSLTWRDVQYLLALTARKATLVTKWFSNAVGFQFSLNYGFGLIDAGAAVRRAVGWHQVPPQQHCQTEPLRPVQTWRGNRVELKIAVSECAAQYLEHVVLTISVRYSRRGNIGVSLTSPSGTTCVMMRGRVFDKSTVGYRFWPLMSVWFWGENPTGEWTVTFLDPLSKRQRGFIDHVQLDLYGTATRAKELPRLTHKPPHVRRSGSSTSLPTNYTVLLSATTTSYLLQAVQRVRSTL